MYFTKLLRSIWSDPRKTKKKKIKEIMAELESEFAKKWASAAHKRLFAAQWFIPNHPEWFDHSIDLYFQWQDTQNGALD